MRQELIKRQKQIQSQIDDWWKDRGYGAYKDQTIIRLENEFFRITKLLASTR